MTAWCAALLAGQIVAPDSGSYSGVRGEIRVPPPRVDAVVQIDGQLDEPVWRRAARLTGFSQFSPADGRPAEEETEVLVWYSPTAVYFGLKASAEAGTVRAHLANRDKGILTDDYLEIHLGTFNDGRQVFVFAANPLGIQADGSLVEGNQQRRGFISDAEGGGGREAADLNPDYTFDSKGRVTDAGYQVEIRIPFKSLRYQSADRQDWSLQIIRRTAHLTREDTWAPARRGAASFLAQAGTLVGLTGLRRGLVLELNPILTSTVDGAPASAPNAWDYGGGAPEPGGNAKWGLSQNLTLNGTVNPDFSQVESDVGEVNPDPRRNIFFAEKRPFFLDGLEFYSTPSQVIYTRRLVAPIAATKLAGKISGTNIGFLSAVDGAETSLSGTDHPVVNLIRLSRDVGGQSRLGFAYTDRIEGRDYNRVAQIDGRVVFGGINSLAFYGALSRTRAESEVATAPMWSVSFNRSGRTFGVQGSFQAVSDQFRAGSGFVSQTNWATSSLSASVTGYGGRGSFVERFVASVFGGLDWTYTRLKAGAPSLNRRVHLRTNSALRGGWNVGTIVFFESFGYDERLFRDYSLAVPRTGGGVDTIPYVGGGRIPSVSGYVSIKSPEVAGFALDGFLAYGQEVNYFEWSKSSVLFSRIGLGFRPTQQLRFEANLPLLIYHRWDDGTYVGGTVIPRLRVEYQVTPAVFLRLVGEYRAVRQDSLHDHTRTKLPILIRDETGVYRRDLALASEQNDLRLDFLFAYQPTPGTVLFLGYGSSLAEERAFRFEGLSRRRDGFFAKLSYLFRL